MKIINYVFAFFSNILSAKSFNILPYYQPIAKTINFHLCDGYSTILKETTIDVFKELNKYELYDFQLREQTLPHIQNDKNTICNLNLDDKYGYCTHYLPFYNETDISISNILLGIDTNLYNVVLHEFLHSIGLDHTDEFGMLNYSVHYLTNGIKKDISKLYLSVDDYQGIKYLYNYNSTNEKDKNECNKNDIIETIKNCL